MEQGGIVRLSSVEVLIVGHLDFVYTWAVARTIAPIPNRRVVGLDELLDRFNRHFPVAVSTVSSQLQD